MKTTLVSIWGGFHNANEIKLRVPAARVPAERAETASWIEEPGILTDSQLKRLHRHMCGIRGCQCSLDHGSKWSA
jgi:hypothetical protein